MPQKEVPHLDNKQKKKNTHRMDLKGYYGKEIKQDKEKKRKEIEEKEEKGNPRILYVTTQEPFSLRFLQLSSVGLAHAALARELHVHHLVSAIATHNER